MLCWASTSNLKPDDVEHALETFDRLGSAMLHCEALLRYRPERITADSAEQKVLKRVLARHAGHDDLARRWLALGLPDSLRSLVSLYDGKDFRQDLAVSRHVWFPAVYPASVKVLPHQEHLATVQSIEVVTRQRPQDPEANLEDPWPARFRRLHDLLGGSGLLPLWNCFSSDGSPLRPDALSSGDHSLDLAAYLAAYIAQNHLQARFPLAATGVIDIETGDLKPVTYLSEKLAAIARDTPWVKFVIIPSSHKEDAIALPPNPARRIYVDNVKSLPKALGGVLRTSSVVGFRHLIVGAALIICVGIVFALSYFSRTRLVRTITPPHDAGYPDRDPPSPRRPAEIRVLLTGDRTDQAIVRVHSTLTAKFDRWRADFLRMNASLPGCLDATPEVRVAFAPSLSAETLRTNRAALGLSLGPESMHGTSGDAGWSANDAVVSIDLSPLRQFLGNPDELMIVYGLPQRPSGLTIEYRPTELIFVPGAFNRGARQVALDLPTSTSTARAWFPISGTLSVARQLPGGGFDVHRIPQNLNYSHASEFVVFQRPDVLRLPPIPYATSTLDESTLHALFHLLLVTFTGAPLAVSRSADGAIGINLGDLLQWLDEDSAMEAPRARVPGEILGPIRHLWADLSLMGISILPEACSPGRPSSGPREAAANHMLQRWCHGEAWYLVADAYRRAATTPHYACPECWLRSAEARLATDDFVHAVDDIEQAIALVQDPRIRAHLALAGAKIALASLAGTGPGTGGFAATERARALLREVRANGFETQSDFEEARIELARSSSSGGTRESTTDGRTARALLERVVARRPCHTLSRFLLAKLLMAGDNAERARARTTLESLMRESMDSPQSACPLSEIDLVEHSVRPEHVLEDLVDAYRAEGECSRAMEALDSWRSRLAARGWTADGVARARQAGSLFYVFPIHGARPTPFRRSSELCP